MRRFFRDQEQLPGTESSRELVTRLPPGTYFLVTEQGGGVVLYRTRPAKLDSGNTDPSSDQTTADASPWANRSVVAVNARNRRYWDRRR